MLDVAFTSQGQLAAALRYFEEEASLADQLQDPHLLGTTRSNLAELHLRLGNRREAARYQTIGLEVAEQYGLPLIAACAVVVAGRLCSADGLNRDAVVLQTAADRVLTDLGTPLHGQDRQISDYMLVQALAALGDERYHAAVREGASRSLVDAIELSRAVLRTVAEG